MKGRSLADFVTNRIKYPRRNYQQNNTRLRRVIFRLHHGGQFSESPLFLINRLINFLECDEQYLRDQ